MPREGICQFGSPKKKDNECYHGVERLQKVLCKSGLEFATMIPRSNRQGKGL
jgi:hypothetical protein